MYIMYNRLNVSSKNKSNTIISNEELPLPKAIRGSSNYVSNISSMIPVKIIGTVYSVTVPNTSNVTNTQLISNSVYFCNQIATYNLNDTNSNHLQTNIMNLYFEKAKHAFRFNMTIPDPDTINNSNINSNNNNVDINTQRRSQLVRQLVTYNILY